MGKRLDLLVACFCMLLCIREAMTEPDSTDTHVRGVRGPLMCKQLCEVSSACRWFEFSPVHLSCTLRFDKPTEKQETAIVQVQTKVHITFE